MNGFERYSGSMLSLLAGGLLIGCATVGGDTVDIAERGDAEAAPRGDAEFYQAIPAGTRIEVRLEQALGTAASEPGDEWTAVVVSDVTDGNDVLLERGAVVRGEVTQAGPVEVEGETRQMLAVEPQRLEVDGESYALDAEVVRAMAEERRDLTTGENAAILGAGTLAGTILGDILLDDALLGAVLGAAGGTAIAIARSDTEIELPEGTVMTLETRSTVRPDAVGLTSNRVPVTPSRQT